MKLSTTETIGASTRVESQRDQVDDIGALRAPETAL